jgi:hypothetical protein
LPKLYGAIDDTNNLEYLAFVVGDEEAFKTNLKHLPRGFTHMTNMSGKYEKKDLLKKFNFDGNIQVCCVKFGLYELKSTIQSALAAANNLNMASKKINARISYEMASDIKRLYTDFVIKNGLDITKIEFEIDNQNVLRYLKDGGLRFRQRSEYHKIADCISHANGHGFRLGNNVLEEGESFKNEFHNRVVKRLIKQK